MIGDRAGRGVVVSRVAIKVYMKRSGIVVIVIVVEITIARNSCVNLGGLGS